MIVFSEEEVGKVFRVYSCGTLRLLLEISKEREEATQPPCCRGLPFRQVVGEKSLFWPHVCFGNSSPVLPSAWG